MNPEDDLDKIDKCLQELGEHFDSVQIFATRCEIGTDDGTVSCSKGSGNWFARYGHVKQWMIKEDEYARCQSRNDAD